MVPHVEHHGFTETGTPGVYEHPGRYQLLLFHDASFHVGFGVNALRLQRTRHSGVGGAGTPDWYTNEKGKRGVNGDRIFEGTVW